MGDSPKRRARKRMYSKAAAEALSARIVELFEEGLNTVEIAAKVNAKEAKVYNMLAALS